MLEIARSFTLLLEPLGHLNDDLENEELVDTDHLNLNQ